MYIYYSRAHHTKIELSNNTEECVCVLYELDCICYRIVPIIKFIYIVCMPLIKSTHTYNRCYYGDMMVHAYYIYCQ